jgi:hypothetical protein
VPDGEPLRSADGPEAEGIEEDEAKENAGELGCGHGLGLRDVGAIAERNGLKGVIGFGPVKDGHHEEAALEGLALGAVGVAMEIEIGRVDVVDGEDAVGGSAEEKEDCGKSAQAGRS